MSSIENIANHNDNLIVQVWPQALKELNYKLLGTVGRENNNEETKRESEKYKFNLSRLD